LVEEKQEEAHSFQKDNQLLSLLSIQDLLLGGSQTRSLMRVALLSLFTLLVITLLTFFGYNSYKNAQTYVDISKELSKQKGVDETFHSKLDKVLESLSIGIYDKYSKDRLTRKNLEDIASKSYDFSLRYIYYFFGSLAIFILIFYLLDREFFIIYLALSAMVSLAFALISPLIMMVVYQAVPILGEVTLSFETKSIISTIEKLFSQKNFILAILVTTFSIIIPLFKSLVILLYGFFKEKGASNKAVNLIEKIGKWSMADVFIVALLVVFFSTKQDIHTSIKLEVGIYFFIGYVLLSMLGSSVIGKRE